MRKGWIILLLCCLLTGCGQKETDKIEDLDFTVVVEEDIPGELKQIVEEKKAGEFKLTYSDDAALYLAIGAGEQPTGGYSMAVNALYLTENAICVETDLIGPSKDEEVSQAVSYPYIIIKLEYRDEPVVFK